MSTPIHPTPPSVGTVPFASARDSLLSAAMGIAAPPWQDEAHRIVAIELLLDAAKSVSGSDDAARLSAGDKRREARNARRRRAMMALLPMALEMASVMFREDRDEDEMPEQAPTENASGTAPQSAE